MSVQPHVVEINSYVPAVATGSDDDNPIGTVQETGTVTGVLFAPDAAITGVTTNNRQYDLVNAGSTGAGTTVIATLLMTGGVNATKDQEKAITLSATPANLNVSAGDVLLFKSTHGGTGLADPGGHVRVTIARATAGA